MSKLLRSLNPALAETYAERGARYRDVTAQAAAGSAFGMTTSLITPRPGDALPSRTSRDTATLARARDMARATARAALDGAECGHREALAV